MPIEVKKSMVYVYPIGKMVKQNVQHNLSNFRYDNKFIFMYFGMACSISRLII